MLRWLPVITFAHVLLTSSLPLLGHALRGEGRNSLICCPATWTQPLLLASLVSLPALLLGRAADEVSL